MIPRGLHVCLVPGANDIPDRAAVTMRISHMGAKSSEWKCNKRTRKKKQESKFRESKVKYGKLSDMVWSMVYSNPYYPKLNKDYYLPLPYLTYDRDRSLTCQAKKVRKPGYLNCFQAEITLRKILPGS